MADFYIRQSLHVASLAALTSSVGVSPGFIAVVDSAPSRRYTAVLAGTFTIDGDHVVAGQDGVQWTDDTNFASGGGGLTPGGDLAGNSTRQKVIGIEEAQIKGHAYSTDPILFGSDTIGIVSDGYSLWISSRSYNVIHKVNPDDWSAPLATISLTDTPVSLFLHGSYVICTAYNTVFIIDWSTNEIVGYVNTANGSNTAYIDDDNKLWISSASGVEHFEMADILAAYPADGGAGVNVVLSEGSAAYLVFGNGFVWATHNGNSNTLTRINPTTDDAVTYTLSGWVNNVIPICTDGYVWISTTDTDVLRYDANDPGTDPTVITLPSGYNMWMTVADGILYVGDNDFGVNKIHSIDIATGLYTASASGINEDDWMNQITVLGTNIWAAVSSASSGYASTPIPLSDTLSVPHTGFPSVTVTGIDLNKNPFPAVVKTGDIIAAVPGSGSPSKVIATDASTFFVLRPSSVVRVHTVSAPGDYTSIPIPLNNTGGTLDLNLVHTIDGAYDGYRYLWVVGYDNSGATPVYYLWKIDSTLVESVVSYVFELTLPATISTIHSIACANGFVIVSIQDGNDSAYKLVKIDASTGDIVSVVMYDTSFGITGVLPTALAATNNEDFAWFFGSFDTDIDGTYGILTRINPSLTVHKINDTTNTITAPAAVDIASTNTLLNDLKTKINAHLIQPGAHLLSDSQNTITTPNSTDVASPYTTATALANAIRNWLGSHTSQFLNFNNQGLQQSGTHYYLDNTNRMTVSAVTDNTDLTSIMLLVNDIRSTYEGHRVQTRRLIHYKTDLSLLTMTSPFTSFSEAQLVLNDVKLRYNYHLVSPLVHDSNDTNNDVTADDATDPNPEWPTAAALANDLKAMLNAHLSQAGVHAMNDVDNFISTPDASTDPLSVITLANALASDTTLGAYNRHRTEAVLATISTGDFSNSVAWDGDGYMYITNLWEPSISRVSVADGYVSNIPIVENPTSVAWDGDGYMYVGCNAGQIHIISVATGEIVNSTLNLGIECQEIAWDGDGYMWVTNPADGIVTRIDRATQTVFDTIAIDYHPYRIFWDHGSPGYMYVMNQANLAPTDVNTVTRVSVATGLIVGAPLALSDWPRSGAWGGDGYAYVNAGFVYKIDTDTGLVVDQLYVGAAEGIAWDGDGYMWITDSNSPNIRRIRQSDFSYSTADVIPIPPLSQLWSGIAFDGSGYMYVVDFAATKLAVRISVATGQIVTANVHLVNDTTNIETLPTIPLLINSTTLADTQSLLNDLVTQYTAHIANTTYHVIEDTVNGITAPAATDTAPSAPTAYALAIDLKASFNNHLIEPDVHFFNDTASTILGPDPVDDTDISGIMTIAYAFGDGYFNVDPYAGTYNFHLLQNSEFVYTVSNYNGVGAAIAKYDVDDQTFILTGQNYSSPVFQETQGQIGQDSIHPPGISVFSWTNSSLLTPQTPLLSLAVDSYNGQFWFLAGGPNETTNPYTLNRVPAFHGVPSPVVDLVVPIAPSRGPVGLASSGISPIRISYMAADYIGDVAWDGELDAIKYPMGGALEFVTLPPPVLWSPGGNIGVDEILPNEIIPGAGVTFTNAGNGMPLIISAAAANVKAVSLMDVLLAGETVTNEMFDGVTIGSGDRVLLCRQTATSENGIYIYQPPNFIPTTDTIACGTRVYVEEGDVFGGRTFQQQLTGVYPGSDKIWQSDIGPHLAPPLTYIASGATLWTTLDTVPAISASTSYGWDLIVVTDSICTNSTTSAVVGRERGTVTYRRAKGSSTLTLSDDSRILTAPTVFQQVISSGAVLLQATRQAANCYFRIRCWYEQVKSNI